MKRGPENLLKETLKHEAEKVRKEFTPPDGGWGWVVCFASFWTNGVIFGTLNTFGVLYVKILEDFSTGDEDIAFKASWIGALQISMTFFMSLLAGVLSDKVGIRKTAFAGALIATGGMLASSFMNRLELLYITYGLLLGFGSSLVYNPSMVILGHYFKKRLGLVNGLVSFGSAVFTIVLPFVEKPILNRWGLQVMFWVLTGLVSTLILCALTWKPLLVKRKAGEEGGANDTFSSFMSIDSIVEQTQGCCRFFKRCCNMRIWRRKGYRVWATALPVAFIGYFIPFVHLVQYTKDMFPSENGAILVMCIAATSGVSRLIFGKLADVQGVNRIRMQQFAFVVLGCSTACIPLAGHFAVVAGITLVMGLCDGCFICLLGPIAFDLLGPKGAAQGIGWLLGVSSIPMTIGPPAAGFMYDALGSYQLAFHVAGIPPLVAAILLFLVPKKQKNTPMLTLTETFAHMSVENLTRIDIDDKLDSTLTNVDTDLENGNTHVLLPSKSSTSTAVREAGKEARQTVSDPLMHSKQ